MAVFCRELRETKRVLCRDWLTRHLQVRWCRERNLRIPREHAGSETLSQLNHTLIRERDACERLDQNQHFWQMSVLNWIGFYFVQGDTPQRALR